MASDPPGPSDRDGKPVALDPDPTRARALIKYRLFGGEVAPRIGRFVVLRRLGAGGMGVVYAAYDEQLDRKVAIKVLAGGDDDVSAARLLREAKAMARLSHPNVVTVHEVGTVEGRVFVAMELLAGPTLAAWLRDQPRTWREVIDVMEQAGRGLAAAHAAGMVHRDFKPANVIVGDDGRVRVLDFGLARANDSDEPRPVRSQAPALPVVETTLTETGHLMGTPAYMSPEQFLGHALLPASDQFSFCVALYEGIYGQRPFAGADASELLAAVTEGRVRAPPPGRDVPAWLHSAVMRGLAAAPEQRWPSMKALLGELGHDRTRARWTRWATLAVAALALAALAALLLWPRFSRPRSVPQPVVTASRRLTYDPGCEEYPAFTPDGRSVLYDGLWDGDFEIIALELTSGRRTRLTHSPSWDYAPTVSPDGRRVAYIHLGIEEEVRVMPIGGDQAAVPITLGRSWGLPAWSAADSVLVGTDREVVAWHSGRPETAHVVARLPDGLQASALAPMKDGEILMVLGTFAQDVPPALWRMQRGGEFVALAARATAYDIGAAPSGDAFYHVRKAPAGGDELVRRLRDGSAPRVVTGGLVPAGGFALAPDGKRMAYSSCKSQSSLARLRLDPGAAVAGGLEPLGVAPWQDASPLALGGGRLLISSDRSGREELWVLERAGGAARSLGPGYRPALSRDRSQVAYSDRTPPGIHVIALAGGPAVRLTDQPSDTGASFTHDGAAVLFIRTTPAGDRLLLAPRSGAAPRELAPGIDVNLAAASPTEDRIVYLRRDADAMAVMVTDAAGAPPRQLGAPLPRAYYEALKFSADGKRLLAIRRETEIVELPLDGAPPVVLWRAATEALSAVDLDDDGALLVAITRWDGDLWLADGVFP